MASSAAMSSDLFKLRHSAAHILAQAVSEYFGPAVLFAGGPPIENGFYYDFHLPRSLVPEDLIAIEARMKEIIREDHAFVREEISFDRARNLFRDQVFKLELISGLERGDGDYDQAEESGEGQKAPLSLYRHANFVDLCKGPHVDSSAKIDPDAIKLMRIAGAYWKGDEKRPMLQRIYGSAWLSKADLDAYLHQLEEAERRDHRRIGKDMELFFFDDSAPGMPYWLPKGLHVLNELFAWWRKVHKRERYQEISSPLLNAKKLWEQSGHWEHYQKEMFLVDSGRGVYGLKPMNCPNAMVLFNHRPRSYRELPLRLSDCDVLHRKERSGSLHGLLRVQKFQQDDAHIFVPDDPQVIEAEYDRVLGLVDEFYRVFQLDYRFRLASRPPDAIGDDASWERAEEALRKVLARHAPQGYERAEGDGAFYGPKIDILIKDALGRDWQMGTIQLDFQLPRRFACEYQDENGQRRVPAVIHRVIYGSMERFVGILLEHCSGRLPLWLCPEQVRVIPIAERHVSRAEEVAAALCEAGLLAECDLQAGSMGHKIRRFQCDRIPYAVIIGDKEMEKGNLSLRSRSGGIEPSELASLIVRLRDEVERKV